VTTIRPGESYLLETGWKLFFSPEICPLYQSSELLTQLVTDGKLKLDILNVRDKQRYVHHLCIQVTNLCDQYIHIRNNVPIVSITFKRQPAHLLFNALLWQPKIAHVTTIAQTSTYLSEECNVLERYSIGRLITFLA
jgi:hypothetical protein